VAPSNVNISSLTPLPFSSINFGKIDVEKHLFSHNRAFFTVDNSQRGYELAITTNKNIRSDLEKAGFEDRFNPQHHENQSNYYQKGDGIVLHLGFLLSPSDQYTSAHYDSGGGSIFNKEHRSDYFNGTGVSPDRATTALGKTSAAPYLRGISESMDRLLTQKKQ
jgi:hypothetical protein